MLLPCECHGPLLGSWRKESACKYVAESAGLQFSWTCVDIGLGREMGGAASSCLGCNVGFSSTVSP